MTVLVGVPVLNNFKGFAELVYSLNNGGAEFIVQDNWNENIGVSKSWNKFIEYALRREFRDLLICNDDIIWKDNSFGKLLEAWWSRPKDALMVTGVAHDVSAGYHEAPDYSCFIFDPFQMVQKVGLFDENFTPAYFEDNDSHYRIKLAGYKAYCHSAARVEHKGSQTQNADPKKPVVTSQMFEANRDYYSRKWGGWPGSEKYTHPYDDESKDWKYWHDNS